MPKVDGKQFEVMPLIAAFRAGYFTFDEYNLNRKIDARLRPNITTFYVFVDGVYSHLSTDRSLWGNVDKYNKIHKK